jgi:hypothetical protein
MVPSERGCALTPKLRCKRLGQTHSGPYRRVPFRLSVRVSTSSYGSLSGTCPSAPVWSSRRFERSSIARKRSLKSQPLRRLRWSERRWEEKP